jgi:hypothetical protein
MSNWQDPVSWMMLHHDDHSQNVSSDSRKWLIKHLFSPISCKKQINRQNSYLLLAFVQSGSVISVKSSAIHFKIKSYLIREIKGPSWSWSYDSWIYIYLCNQCLSPLKTVSSNPVQGEVYSIQHVIQFVSILFWNVLRYFWHWLAWPRWTFIRYAQNWKNVKPNSLGAIKPRMFMPQVYRRTRTNTIECIKMFFSLRHRWPLAV